MKWRRVT